MYSLSQRTGCFQGVLTLLKDRVFSGCTHSKDGVSSGCIHSKDRVFSGCIHSLKGQGVFRVYSLS